MSRRHARRAARGGSPRNVVELVLSELPGAPAAAHRARRASPRELGVGEPRWTRRGPRGATTTRAIPYLAFQHELCISCGRCVRACDEVQGAFALTADRARLRRERRRRARRGFRDSACVSCGACADTCPTDAITELSLLAIADATRG